MANQRTSGSDEESRADASGLSDTEGWEDVGFDVAKEPEQELAAPLPRAEGPHYEAFDLLRNRPIAHRTSYQEDRRSVWIDASAPDFVRYIQGNHRRDWHLNVMPGSGNTDPETGMAAPQGRVARLTMPAFGEDSEVLEMRIFNPVKGDNRLDLRVDGQRISPVELEGGWQRVKIDLADVAVGEDVSIRLEFSNLGRFDGALSGGAIHWLRLGPRISEKSVLPTTMDGQGPVTLSEREGLKWVAWLHDDALLELEVEATAPCGPSVQVALEDGQGGVEEVLYEAIELVEGRGARQVTTLEIPVEESQVARLHVAGSADDECAEVRLEGARLIRPGRVQGVPEDFEAPKYVVIWMIDTLRADFLPLHFDTDVKAPNLQRLADEGVSFETAFVQGTESRASHASLFTAQYPERHGVMEGGTVDPQLSILPHFYHDEGYRTANISANGYVSHLLNLDRGWDHYRNLIHEETAVNAGFIADAALGWLRSWDEEPFLLYLGTIDPHATYRRHGSFIGLYEPEDYSGRFQRHLSGLDLEEIKLGTMEVTEREKQRIINLYKNEITYNDHVFGEFRQALEDKGIWEDTLVVVSSDHGEEFWERGSVGHGHSVHQEMVHVPLIFHYPGGLPQGRRVRSGGEVVDMLPTLLDMLGVDRPEDRQGKSLLPTIFGEHGGYPAPVVATQYGLKYSLQIRNWKIYLRSGSMRVYDRRVDPAAKKNVADAHPLASRWLQDSVGLFRFYARDWDKARWGVPNNVSAQFLDVSTSTE